jgi:hypothetical protein
MRQTFIRPNIYFFPAYLEDKTPLFIFFLENKLIDTNLDLFVTGLRPIMIFLSPLLDLRG